MSDHEEVKTKLSAVELELLAVKEVIGTYTAAQWEVARQRESLANEVKAEWFVLRNYSIQELK